MPYGKYTIHLSFVQLMVRCVYPPPRPELSREKLWSISYKRITKTIKYNLQEINKRGYLRSNRAFLSKTAKA